MTDAEFSRHVDGECAMALLRAEPREGVVVSAETLIRALRYVGAQLDVVDAGIATSTARGSCFARRRTVKYADRGSRFVAQQEAANEVRYWSDRERRAVH